MDWQTPSFGDPVYVIGDIHGNITALEALNEKLDPSIPRILVGDYVDRGQDSARVLEYVSQSAEMTCLIGNHEQMLLNFLDRPTEASKMWFKNGGLQTLLSYGVPVPSTPKTADAQIDIAEALRAKMGDTTVSWLQNLSHYLHLGNVVAVHAALDPGDAVSNQTADTMLWGHKDFFQKTRSDGNWVVHGHTIVPEPLCEQGRISIDTGAYATGVLTAALLGDGAPRFVQSK
ncbi:MAG: serine/threonine protein phosphatase [Rhodobacteraceae bacterium]|nr:serine/threonine protein phosphatase [Paracoccaceae bacterium]